MAIFEIVGKTSLNGHVNISGAKNEALKLIPLAILLGGDFQMKNVPAISDVVTQSEIFKALGGRADFESGILSLNSSGISSFKIPDELSAKLRASIVYAGPLLAKFGRAEFSCPGGCVIGARSIETHLDVFAQAGVKIEQEDGYFSLDAREVKDKQLNIELSEKSVTATENIILFLCLGSNHAKIKNVAVEPEVMHLIKVINDAGGNISIENDNVLVVSGVQELSLDVAEVIPDRIEAGTFAIAIAATGGEGTVDPYPAEYLESFTQKLIESGVDITIDGSRAIIKKSSNLRPIQIETAPYPGFPTDLQSPMSLVAAVADGKSFIKESMFDNRLGYLKELESMGLRVSILNEHEAEIEGPTEFKPKVIDSLDLRSGITVLIAATMSQGKSILKKAEIVDRGYEKIETKLNSLGAKIKRSE